MNNPRITRINANTKAKERENVFRPGVDFAEAQHAFLDPLRLIMVDEEHTEIEPRFFCIGRTARGILTIRYTRRADIIRIIGGGILEERQENV